MTLKSKNVPLRMRDYDCTSFYGRNADLGLAGNDDSGPEDAEDDLDLECDACFRLSEFARLTACQEPAIRQVLDSGLHV
jgi:hypothetical protein